jgi:hypothetical protein
LAVAALVMACVSTLEVAAGSYQQRPLPDVSVKAAFVSRFPEFVEWPASAHHAGSPVVVCLSGSHPFGDAVQALLRGAVIRHRPVEVRVLWSSDAAGCHLLYVANDDIGLLRAVRGRPVLTVGDRDDFIALGGIINLRVIAERVRFEVNLAESRRAGLTIDSQLLGLAVAVFGGGS